MGFYLAVPVCGSCIWSASWLTRNAGTAFWMRVEALQYWSAGLMVGVFGLCGRCGARNRLERSPRGRPIEGPVGVGDHDEGRAARSGWNACHPVQVTLVTLWTAKRLGKGRTFLTITMSIGRKRFCFLFKRLRWFAGSDCSCLLRSSRKRCKCLRLAGAHSP